MEIWLALAGMAAVTFLARAVGLLALRGEPPRWVLRWLGHVPVAVFTALAIPALLVRAGARGPELVLGPALAAGVAGGLVAWRGGGVVLTIVAGLTAFWGMRWAGW